MKNHIYVNLIGEKNRGTQYGIRVSLSVKEDKEQYALMEKDVEQIKASFEIKK
ncbi:hypothetical protein [Paenibacillus sp. Soil787]|uniref:hypothetical protein n=1 Tax=Paenibacillus sp. Soil787 TaxID=1736411 RepID=UPI000AE19353|nr:hypothetical protein [Paenibacillus sp. Soil787]